MSSPREIVSQTLNFENPERVARSFQESDFVWAQPEVKTYGTDWQQDENGFWTRFDEWGNRWGRIDNSSKGEVIQGVLQSLDGLDEYGFPDFSKQENYECIKQIRARYSDQWLIGGLPGFTFNIARKFLRMDHYLLALAAEPLKVHALNDRIDLVLVDLIRNYAMAGVDSVMFPEDWGTQLQTLISPRMWRDEFYPRFVSLCSLAHQHGVKVFMHSCGQIRAIVPDLIQAGIDVLQFDQPDLHGIDNLTAYQQVSPITFWCPVDIQTTLQSKSESIIRAKVQEMITKLWSAKGGFIAGYYDDNESIGLEPCWQNIACEEFIKFGVRRNFL